MLRAGAILLSIWTGLNLVLALGILFMLLMLRDKCARVAHPLHGDLQAAGIDPRALATINGLAVVFNACAAAICGLSLSVIWVAFAAQLLGILVDCDLSWFPFRRPDSPAIRFSIIRTSSRMSALPCCCYLA